MATAEFTKASYKLIWNAIFEKLIGEHPYQSFGDVNLKGLPFHHTNRIISAHGQPYDLVLTRRMFSPELVKGKLAIWTKRVGTCEYHFSSEFSAIHKAILRLAGAELHAIFAMIDFKDNIKKLIVFCHETNVSIKQPSCHKFTLRGIVVTDHTFGTSNAQFKKSCQ